MALTVASSNEFWRMITALKEKEKKKESYFISV